MPMKVVAVGISTLRSLTVPGEVCRLKTVPGVLGAVITVAPSPAPLITTSSPLYSRPPARV